jgi:4-hydroxybenzoate polyprenyltransferase
MSVEKSSDWITHLDYFFVLRPMLFYPGWSTMLAGYFIAYRSEIRLPIINQSLLNHGYILLLILAFGMLMGSTFVLNQIKDVKSDQKNKKLFIISNGYLTLQDAIKEVVLLAYFSFLLAFFLNFVTGICFILFFVIAGILYNFAPFTMKDRPWGSLAANALMGWFAFAIGWAAKNQVTSAVLTDSIPYLLFNTALYLFTTLPDIEGDRLAGKRTLAVMYGSKWLIIGAFLLYVSGLIFSLVIIELQALFFYILSFPFFIKTVITLNIADTLRTTKFGILFFALSICLRWPIYFVLMLLGFVCTKAYFRKRFNLNYPNFSGV